MIHPRSSRPARIAAPCLEKTRSGEGHEGGLMDSMSCTSASAIYNNEDLIEVLACSL